mmetsp:Transcript_12046/g.16081  ORF Transcript_12046/g.16081 Transcript_12046/m.16081 type:complete len:144 (-) Transcript_12046:231-662(-)
MCPLKWRIGKTALSTSRQFSCKIWSLPSEHKGIVCTAKNKLCYFVSWQRKQYKLFKEGKPSHLTQKRVDRLSELGFDFNPNAKKRTDEENFDECYILLCDFATEHGHCNAGVDRGQLGGPRLTKFVAWQRKQYVLFQKGKESK